MGNDPTFENHLGSSIIDLTLTKNAEILNWNNTREQFGSDHYVLTFQISCFPSISNKTMQNISNTDWSIFTSSLPPLPVADISTTSQLEDRAREFVNVVKAAFDRACPPPPRKLSPQDHVDGGIKTSEIS